MARFSAAMLITNNGVSDKCAFLISLVYGEDLFI